MLASGASSPSTPPGEAAQPAKLAEMLLHLARLAQGEARADGLTPAQWSALRYFGRANRFSRTASAFASFHATTRGTASQTIKSLIARGYLRRTPSRHDRRSARIDLTEKGSQALAGDPFRALIRAVSALPPGQSAGLAQTLRGLAADVAEARQTPYFGCCHECRHLEGGEGGTPPYCHCVEERLAPEELDFLCVDCLPRAPGGRGSERR